jgi:hypothetical protein
LTVLTESQATRVVFDTAKSSTGLLVAKSVEVSRGGKLETVSAKKEIILSAGKAIFIATVSAQHGNRYL